MLKNKKGQVNEIPGFILALVLIGVFLVVGLIVMGQLQDSQTAGSTTYNASGDVIEAMEDITDWIPIIVVVVIASIVIGILGFLQYRRR